MPHLEIQYSRNVGPLDAGALLEAAMAALDSLGYDMPTTKARIVPLDEFAVGHPDDGSGFLAATVWLLAGRDESTKLATSRAITEALTRELAPALRTQVTTAIVELDPGSYTKTVLPGRS